MRRIDQDGLVGVLCTPEGSGPAPGVLLLGGSEGGLHERDAAVLAEAGFTVLALAYFGAPGLPGGLVDVPLEYFFRGLDLLAAEPRVRGRLAVLGGSRGAEAALLVAAHDPRVRAVVGVAGSGIVTPGIDFARGTLLDILAAPVAAWTLAGAPLPYLSHVVDDELRRRVADGAPVPLRLAYPPVPADEAELARLSIPVERIDGPVLLLAGDSDAMWPAVEYGRVAMHRLQANEHPHPFVHRVFEGVGHPIAGPPGEPFTGTVSPGPGVSFELGGSAPANTAARKEVWTETVDFLRAFLR